MRSNIMSQMMAANGSDYDYDNFRGLVILVEFNDRQFMEQDANRIFHDMINVEGYKGFVNSAGKTEEYTGSVKDYFISNSRGKFVPEFDVAGPVKIDRSATYPHGSDNRSTYITEALVAADSIVDYSKYDLDKDGVTDMIYFIFAGAGSNYSGNNAGYVWPHAAYVPWSRSLDGVKFGRYACSTELYGRENDKIIDGIGTICHEFSHCLGLYDVYDTDYETSGLSLSPLDWSLMASGSYLNNARTPCGYSLFERIEAGFAEAVTIDKEESLELEHIATSNTGYRIDSEIKDEYFLLENRQQKGWDEYLPGHGLIVFRVDKTNPLVWERNKINCDPKHNYYELLRAKLSYNSRGEAVDGPGDPFPGTGGVTMLSSLTTPSLRSWTGMESLWTLTDITEAPDGRILFNVVKDGPDIILEDFELCPETDGSNVSVDGIVKGWQLNDKAKIQIEVSDNGVNKQVASVMGSSIVSPVMNREVEFIKADLINPTNYTSVFKCEYQPTGSETWQTLKTIDGENECSVKAKQLQSPVFACTNPQPGRFRIIQSTGNKTSAIDNIGIYMKRNISTGIAPTDIADLSASPLTVAKMGEMLHITCLPHIPVRIIRADGVCMSRILPSGNSVDLNISQHGLFIIIQGQNSIKINL